MIPRKPLKVYRQSGGEYVNGIWQPGTETEITVRVSVQPSSPDDMELLPEGRRERRAYTLFGDDALLGVGDDNPDQVEIDGERYEVSAVQYWRNSIIPHTRTVVTRLPEQSND